MVKDSGSLPLYVSVWLIWLAQFTCFCLVDLARSIYLFLFVERGSLNSFVSVSRMWLASIACF